MEMQRKIGGGAALFLVLTIGSAPRSAPAQDTYFREIPDGFVAFSIQRQKWVDEMNTTVCAGDCPGKASDCCDAAMPM